MSRLRVWPLAILLASGCKTDEPSYRTLGDVDATVPIIDASPRSQETDPPDGGSITPRTDAGRPEAEPPPPWDGAPIEPTRPLIHYPPAETEACTRSPTPTWVRTYGAAGTDESLSAVAELPSGTLVAGGAAPSATASPGMTSWWMITTDPGGALGVSATGAGPATISDAKLLDLGHPFVGLLLRGTTGGSTTAGSILEYVEGAAGPTDYLSQACGSESIARGYSRGGIYTIGSSGFTGTAPVGCSSFVHFGVGPVGNSFPAVTGYETGGADGFVTPEDTLFVVGWASRVAEQQQILAADLYGPSEWAALFGDFDDDVGVAAEPGPDGLRLVLGTMQLDDGVLDRDVVLIALRADQSVAFTRRYGTDGVDDEARDLVAMPDGGTMIVASRRDPSGTERPWIVRADADGHARWSLEIDGPDVHVERATASADGSLVIAGTQRGSHADGWLARVPGAAACP